MADLYVFDDGTVIDVSAVDGEFSIVPVAGIQGPPGLLALPGLRGILVQRRRFRLVLSRLGRLVRRRM